MSTKSKGPLCSGHALSTSSLAASQLHEFSNAAAQEELKKRAGGGSWTVRKGDTLAGIAASRYGNGALWGSIRDANREDVSSGGDLIAVGAVLDIPVLDLPDASPDASTGSSGAKPATEPEFRSTDFGDFEIFPDTLVGPLPHSHDAIQVVRRSSFLRLEADAATQTVDPDVAVLEVGTTFVEPVVVTIAGEKVRVSSKAEATHAARMIQEIKQVYGVRVDSSAGVDAIKAQYTKVPASELDKLKSKEWEYKEVLALHSALSQFAPILGSKRSTSSRADVDQEITSVSKLDQAIDKNSPSGTLDTSTLGEYFKGSKNFSTFSAGTDRSTDFDDNQKQLEGTAIHEIAHALLRDEVDTYATATVYWTDKNTKSGTAGAEEPITSYGKKNAREDLSEAVMYYFVERETLRTQCPGRFAHIEGLVAGWSKKP